MNSLANKDLTLDIQGLVVEYHTDDAIVYALNGLDIQIESGKTLGLVGETGAGKTTAALSILQLVDPITGVIVDGKILLDGEDVRVKSDAEMGQIRGDLVSMIFQDPMTSLNPVLTIEDQIAEVIAHHRDVSKKESLVTAREMLELVGIPGWRGAEYPHQFSGGMKQRVVIAIALACNPHLLIADEATTALDVTIQAQVLVMMRELREKFNTSMLMITHDLGIVAEICDTVAIIYAGQIVEYGTLEDVFENTLHPYTEGLFNSLPDVEDRNSRLKPIKGLMLDPTDIPPGCPFVARCDYAVKECETINPGKLYQSDTHYVKCHRYNESNIKKA